MINFIPSKSQMLINSYDCCAMWMIGGQLICNAVQKIEDYYKLGLTNLVSAGFQIQLFTFF